jgi:hypothetical protein
MTASAGPPITLGIDPGTATLGYGIISGDTSANSSSAFIQLWWPWNNSFSRET